jgi:Fe-S-cluster-containing hydrogenase component 2
MSDDGPVIDQEWCIGCGVCATVCTTEAVILSRREDKSEERPAGTFSELHQKIQSEKKVAQR